MCYSKITNLNYTLCAKYIVLVNPPKQNARDIPDQTVKKTIT